MNKLKQILAGLAAVSCILTTVSCSFGNGEKKNSTATPQTADKVMEKAYRAVEIGGDVPFEYIDSFNRLGDTGNILISGNEKESNESKLYITDKDFLTFEEIPFEVTHGENADSYFRTTVTKSGLIFVLSTVNDYGDVEQPDYEDPDFDYENFDFEALEEARVTTQTLYTIDSTGQILSECELKGLDKYSDSEEQTPYINDFNAIGEDKVLISVSGMSKMTYLTVDAEGTLSDPIDVGGDGWFMASGNDSDGNFVFVTYDNDHNVIKTIDSETLEVLPDTISLKDSDSNFRAIMPGLGDYKMLVSNSTSLLGVKADGTLEELVNWIDSDLTGDYIQGVLPMENDDFVIYEQNWNDGSTGFYQLTKRDASELENTQVINMVMSYTDNQILDRVKEFNKTSTDVRIKVEDYNKYYEWDEKENKQLNSPEDQLKQDIAAGKAVDIICMDGGSALFKNLSNKGAMVDLYEYMGKDGTVSKDDILPPIISAGEVDGKLTSISPSCYVETLACKTKYFDKENWTFDEMIETYENLPEGMKLFREDNSKQSVFSRFIYGSNTFIDQEKGTCTFDSPEFIKILEFCNTFDNQGEGDAIDWENASNEEMEAYWREQEVACRNDKALLTTVFFSEMRAYARALTADFGDDITLVGYPSSDGTGARLSTNQSFGIMANSANKDACWNFISTFFSEDYQTGENMYNIPALKTAFEQRLDDSMEKPYYTDENGKKVEYDDTYYINDEEVKIPPLTKEQRDYVEQYILNVKSSSSYYDNDVYNIINEEIETFFAGEKTAQETASIIQNRVSILISEQS
ncbi:MAG: extracellular solute-binding protein [Ruminococcus sp.]|nr:extracellular solute-binding protein [Ruminococcus sp.]